EDYVGGAELTTEALASSSGLNVQKLHASHVTMELLADGVEKYWIFGNFSSLNPELIPSIVGNMTYSILEYDYKFCAYRSIEKHKFETGNECDCHEQIHGKIISSFFHGAKSIWWMSEEQEKRYIERFPFLAQNPRVVLSSVFDESFFAAVRMLTEQNKDAERKGWVVLGSDSWIKGASAAEAYCQENDLEYEVVWNIPYQDILQKLAVAKGFVYLPEGGDTCPRMVIEAKLLGCELVLNDHVQHKNEEWFSGVSELDTLSYLYAARDRFWNAIKANMGYGTTISGYTTLRNANDMGYPWKACIGSMLGFCNEVVVVDGGSTDGTWEELEVLSKVEERLVVQRFEIDANHPSFAYESDGKLKARARALCTSDFCWQMDADEIVHEDDYEKIHKLLISFPKLVDVMALPIVEYWGSIEKVRVDVNPWKWRLSRNLPSITQGIPADLRKFDDDGHEYAAFGTDTCDYIHTETRERLQFVSFYTQEVHETRVAALGGNTAALEAYEEWFNGLVQHLPGVHHYSWFDIGNKIRQYKKHWGAFWKSQYRFDVDDTAENNVMFDKPWDEVTDSDIDEMAPRLAEHFGGWIFHEKVDFSKTTPHVAINRDHPQAFLDSFKMD
ncbi:hypothetical protein CMI47_02395, partial [Candidatus Pacearchaeota archaeon]|nr:hypothetical protein [Candidatus Pacearchaeota archaeon]